MKKRADMKKRKQILSTLIPLLVVAMLLCIPYTNAVFVGVFGYAVYAYFLLAAAFMFKYIKGIKIKISKKRAALYISIFIFVILTLHIAFSKDYIQAGWGSYLIDPFQGGTAGGMLMSAVSCIIAVPLGYTISLVLSFVTAATLLFMAIFPLFLNREKSAANNSRPEADDSEKEDLKRRLLKTFEAEDTKPQDELTVLPPFEVKEESDAMKMFMFGKKAKTPPQPMAEKGVFPEVDGLSAEDAVYTNNHRRKILEQDAKNYLFPTSAQKTEIPINKTENSFVSEPKREPVIPAVPHQSPMAIPVEKPVIKPVEKTAPAGTAYNIGNVYMPRKSAATGEDVYDDAYRLKEKTAKDPAASYDKPAVDVYDDSFRLKDKFATPQSAPSAMQSETAEIKPEIQNVINQSESRNYFEEDFDEIKEVTVDDVWEEDLADEVTAAESVAEKTEEIKPAEVVVRQPVSDWRKKLMEKAQKKEEVSVEYRQPVLPNLDDEEKDTADEEEYSRKPYVAPHLGLLSDHTVRDYTDRVSEDEYRQNKEIIEGTLESFGIKAEVVKVIKGPVVTRYELMLISGSVSKVANLKLDLTMRLSSKGMVDIIAPIEGKDAIGVDIPNTIRNNVSFRDIVNSDAFMNDRNGLKIALGKEIDGTPYVADLEAMPHLLVAGATGKGKSVCINTIICSILFQHSPDEVKFLLIDPKLVELVHYSGLPHMLLPEPLNELPTVVRALRWVEAETKQRFELFKATRNLSINAYNQYARENGLKPKYKIVVIIDEASELMMRAKKETEEVLSSLARIGRAAGVHLIFATQSPAKEIITSEIQNNLNTKIAFAVGDYIHSMVIFKAKGAERLLGRGDMLLRGDGGQMTRIQCSLITTEEKERIVEFINKNNEKRFDKKIYDEIMAPPEPEREEYVSPEVRRLTVEKTPLNDDIKRALLIGFKHGGISTSLLQRKMGKGFGVAGRIVDFLEENRMIETGETNTNRKRKILISKEEFLEQFPEVAEEFEEYYQETLQDF